MRGNRGGLPPNGFPVLDRLIESPYPRWTSLQARIREVPDRYHPFVSRFVPTRLTDIFQSGPPYHIEGDPLVEWMHPVGDFTGEVAVLTDGLTNSAANTFVTSLETYRPDTRVAGQAPGGACDAHIGELPVALVLPHTGVAVVMSLVEIHHVAPQRCVPGHGLAPDLAVSWTVQDLVDGTDPVVQAVLDAWASPRVDDSPPRSAHRPADRESHP